METPEVITLTEEDGRALFDRRCREEMGISGREFLSRWDAGEFAGDENTAAVGLSMLEPFARTVRA